MSRLYSKFLVFLLFVAFVEEVFADGSNTSVGSAGDLNAKVSVDASASMSATSTNSGTTATTGSVEARVTLEITNASAERPIPATCKNLTNTKHLICSEKTRVGYMDNHVTCVAAGEGEISNELIFSSTAPAKPSVQCKRCDLHTTENSTAVVLNCFECVDLLDEKRKNVTDILFLVSFVSIANYTSNDNSSLSVNVVRN